MVTTNFFGPQTTCGYECDIITKDSICNSLTTNSIHYYAICECLQIASNWLKRELFKRYDECKKYLIPKSELYYKIIDSLKSASALIHTKSRTGYYLLTK